MKPKNIDEFLNCLALKGALLRLLLMFLFDNLVAGIIQKIGLFSPSIFKNNSFSSLFCSIVQTIYLILLSVQFLCYS